MRKTTRASLCAVIIGLSAAVAQAETLMFENLAPPGSVTNINPAFPYTEVGFTISVTNAAAAVVDSASTFDMFGNTTDFFGFAGINTPTLTYIGGSFDLASLLLGPTTVGGALVNMSVTGNLAAGGTLNASFPGLTTATVANLNWQGLQSVSFAATSDAGLDNIVVNPSVSVPEPQSLMLLALGLLGVRMAGKRRG